MKILIAFLVVTFCSFLHPASAQMAMSFEEARTHGLDFKNLDSIYTTGVGNDSSAVFHGQEDAYVKAYYAMLQELGSFLNDHNFFWGGQVRCNNRIYFDVDGSIDYYLFDFEANLPQSKKDEFKKLLGQFIINFKFDLKAKQRFAQCSPVNYRDPL